MGGDSRNPSSSRDQGEVIGMDHKWEDLVSYVTLSSSRVRGDVREWFIKGKIRLKMGLEKDHKMGRFGEYGIRNNLRSQWIHAGNCMDHLCLNYKMFLSSGIDWFCIWELFM